MNGLTNLTPIRLREGTSVDPNLSTEVVRIGLLNAVWSATPTTAIGLPGGDLSHADATSGNTESKVIRRQIS